MSAFAPENTLAAFKMAYENGADGIELDVQLSKDEKIIVFHDKSLSRITGQRNRINELSLEEIKTLDGGSWFDIKFSGEKIPTLREVFESNPQDKNINIEIKGSNIRIIDQVILLIKEFNIQSKVIVSSFNTKFLKIISSKYPEIKIGLLALPNIAGFWHRKYINQSLKPDALHVFYKDVSAKMIEEAHSKGQTVHAYTVNDPEEMDILFSKKIDMLMTDDPILGIKQRDKFLI